MQNEQQANNGVMSEQDFLVLASTLTLKERAELLAKLEANAKVNATA